MQSIAVLRKSFVTFVTFSARVLTPKRTVIAAGVTPLAKMSVWRHKRAVRARALAGWGLPALIAWPASTIFYWMLNIVVIAIGIAAAATLAVCWFTSWSLNPGWQIVLASLVVEGAVIPISLMQGRYRRRFDRSDSYFVGWTHRDFPVFAFSAKAPARGVPEEPARTADRVAEQSGKSGKKGWRFRLWRHRDDPLLSLVGPVVVAVTFGVSTFHIPVPFLRSEVFFEAWGEPAFPAHKRQ